MSAVAATGTPVETSTTKKKQGWFSRFRQWTGDQIKKVKTRVSESFVGKAARWVSNLGNTKNEETGEVTRNALGVVMDIGVGIVTLPFKVVGGTCSLVAEACVSPKKAMKRLSYNVTKVVKCFVRLFGVTWWRDEDGKKHVDLDGVIGLWWGFFFGLIFGTPLIEAGYVAWGIGLIVAPLAVAAFMNWSAARQMWKVYTPSFHATQMEWKRASQTAANVQQQENMVKNLGSVTAELERKAKLQQEGTEKARLTAGNAAAATEGMEKAIAAAEEAVKVLQTKLKTLESQDTSSDEEDSPPAIEADGIIPSDDPRGEDAKDVA